MRKYFPRIIEIGILLMLSLTPLIWLVGTKGIIGHDSGFRLQGFGYLRTMLYAWTPTFDYGTDHSKFFGFLLMQLPETVLYELTGSLVWSERILFCAWFFVMMGSMYVLASYVFPGKKYWFVRISASLGYGFNFYVLQGWFIAERAKFSLYAALPLVLVLIFRALIDGGSAVVSGLSVGLLLFVLNGGGSPPLYGSVILVFALAISASTIWGIRKFGRRGLIHPLVFVVASAMSYVTANAYFLFPFAGMYANAYQGTLSGLGGIDGLLSWERMVSQLATMGNLFRLQGVMDFAGNEPMMESFPFLRTPYFAVVGLFPILVVFGGLATVGFRRLDSKRKIMGMTFLAILVVGLFFAEGSHPPLGVVYTLLMKYVPGFAIFRSSIHKFMPMIAVSLVLLAAYFSDRLLGLVPWMKGRMVVAVGICLGILLYSYPFFSPDHFRFRGVYSRV